MGGSESKEEVIITQATSGDATSTHRTQDDAFVSKKDILIIMIAVTLNFLLQYLYKKCMARIEGKVKKQIIIQTLGKSIDNVANAQV